MPVALQDLARYRSRGKPQPFKRSFLNARRDGGIISHRPGYFTVRDSLSGLEESLSVPLHFLGPQQKL